MKHVIFTTTAQSVSFVIHLFQRMPKALSFMQILTMKWRPILKLKVAIVNPVVNTVSKAVGTPHM